MRVAARRPGTAGAAVSAPSGAFFFAVQPELGRPPEAARADSTDRRIRASQRGPRPASAAAKLQSFRRVAADRVETGLTRSLERGGGRPAGRGPAPLEGGAGDWIVVTCNMHRSGRTTARSRSNDLLGPRRGRRARRDRDQPDTKSLWRARSEGVEEGALPWQADREIHGQEGERRR